MHLPLRLASRCGARTRRASACRAPAMPNGRCRLHGGKSTGPPKGNKNALNSGRYTTQAIAPEARVAGAVAGHQSRFAPLKLSQTRISSLATATICFSNRIGAEFGKLAAQAHRRPLH